MPAIAGYRGRVRMGQRAGILLTEVAPALPVIRWSLTWKQESVDITSSGSGIVYQNTSSGAFHNQPKAGTKSETGLFFKEYLRGYTDVEVSLDILWDSTLFPFNSDYNNRTVYLIPGNEVDADLQIIKDDANNHFYLPSILIETVNVEQLVREVSKWTITGRMNLHTNAITFTNRQDIDTSNNVSLFTYPQNTSKDNF